ncbi:MAG: hypothetical protein ACHQ2Z_04610 [Elusimicrobiota bacterium]
MKLSIVFAAVLSLAVVATSPSRAIELTPSLSQSYAGALQALKSAVAVLRLSETARVSDAQSPALQTKSFHLICNGRVWLQSPAPSTPGAGISMLVNKGDHVEVRISYYPSTSSERPVAFDLNKLDVLIDGKPSKGAHLRLKPRTEVVLEFDAATPGLYQIDNPQGRILIRG